MRTSKKYAAICLYLVSCSSHVAEIEGCWVSSNLDFICFGDHSTCDLASRYAIHVSEGQYSLENNQVLKLDLPSEFCLNRSSCVLEFNALVTDDSLQLLALNDDARDYFIHLGTFYRDSSYLIYSEWDSIRLERYSGISMTDSYRLIEIVTLSSNGKISRELIRDDSIKRKIYYYKMPMKDQKILSQEISHINTKYFQLMQDEVADDYFNVLYVYRGMDVNQFLGYDIPTYFDRLKSFLNNDIYYLAPTDSLILSSTLDTNSHSKNISPQ